MIVSTTDLGLSICLSMFKLRETGDWNIFLAHHLKKTWQNLQEKTGAR